MSENGWTPGERVLQYEILGRLGAGGMGVAYRAFDTRLKRTVALKTLHARPDGTPGRSRQLLREARAAAPLVHPNICTVYAVETVGDVSMIAMEYVDGRTLSAVIQSGPLAPRRAAALAMQVADALAWAHGKGIVHRDIKPSNIMLADDGQIKVLDFGLAHSPTREMDSTNVATTIAGGGGGPFAGTPAYMSPEQLAGDDLDPRTDIFSLGIVLYELCTGRHPFEAKTRFAMAARILTSEVAPIASIVPGFPDAMDRVVLRCLEKDRARRHRGAAQLIEELREVSSAPLWRSRHDDSRPSVAVLPFSLAGRPGGDEYFSDGITSDVTTLLARTGRLLVISRSSTMRYRGSDRDVREIGAELGVGCVVEGSIRRAGNRCVIDIRLVDVRNAFHLWADTFEADMTEIFAVQERIADGVASALAGPAVEPRTARAVPTGNVRAYEAYLRALHAYHKFTSADNLIAIELLRDAVARDPSYARAHALLATAYLARVERLWEPDARLWIERAMAAISTALGLDAGISEAYAARALVSTVLGRQGEAEADVGEALRADPNNDIALDLLGRIRFARGEFRGAISAFEDALRISPYYVWCLNDLVWAQWLSGDEDAARATIARVLAISPMDEGGHTGKAGMLYIDRRIPEALAEIGLAQQSNPEYPFIGFLLAPILAAAGREAEAKAVCEALISSPGATFFGHAGFAIVALETGDSDGVERSIAQALEVRAPFPAINLNYAEIFSRAGEIEAARRWVEKAVAEGIRLVEADEWHPLLRELARGSGVHSHKEGHG